MSARLLPILGLLLAAAPVHAADQEAGTLYPAPTQNEVVRSPADPREDATAAERRRFAASLSRALAGSGLGDLGVQAAGGEAERLVIVAVRGGLVDTPFRARALLARLGPLARDLAPFIAAPPEPAWGFVDMARRLGFERVTVSDGDEVAVQALLR